MSMEIKDKGFTGAGKEISQQLLKLNKEVLTKGSIIIQSAAVQYAPYDTGTLRNSITKDIFKFYAVVGTNIEYAIHQEYGTSKMDGQPFMRPAFDNNERKIYKMYKDGLKKIK